MKIKVNFRVNLLVVGHIFPVVFKTNKFIVEKNNLCIFNDIQDHIITNNKDNSISNLNLIKKC